jgi:hypothetical protein
MLHMDPNFVEDDWLGEMSKMGELGSDMGVVWADEENMRNSQYFSATPKKELMTPEMVRNRMVAQMQTMSAKKQPIGYGGYGDYGDNNGSVTPLRKRFTPMKGAHGASTKKMPAGMITPTPTMGLHGHAHQSHSHLSGGQYGQQQQQGNRTQDPYYSSSGRSPVAPLMASHTHTSTPAKTPATSCPTYAHAHAQALMLSSPALSPIPQAIPTHASPTLGPVSREESELPLTPLNTGPTDGIAMRVVASARKKDLFVDEDSFISDDSSMDSRDPHSFVGRTSTGVDRGTDANALSASVETQTVISSSAFPIVDVTSDGTALSVMNISPRQASHSHMVSMSHARASGNGRGNGNGNCNGYRTRSRSRRGNTGSEHGSDSDEREAGEDLWTSVASIVPAQQDQSTTPDKSYYKSLKAAPGPLFRHSPGLSPISSSLAREAQSQARLLVAQREAHALGVADKSVLNTSPTEDIHPQDVLGCSRSRTHRFDDIVGDEKVKEEEKEEKEDGCGHHDSLSRSLQSMSFIADDTTMTSLQSTATAPTTPTAHSHSQSAPSPQHSVLGRGRPPLPVSRTRSPLGSSSAGPRGYSPPLAPSLGYGMVSRTYPGSWRVGIYFPSSKYSSVGSVLGKGMGVGMGMGAYGGVGAAATTITHSSGFWRSRLQTRKKLI